MKNLVFILSNLLSTCFLTAQYSVGSISNGEPVVSLSFQNVETALNQHFAQYDGSSTVTLDSIKIEDEDLNDSTNDQSIIYYYRVHINSENNDLSIATRYKLNYYPYINEYDLDENECEVDGGKFSCAKENCKGCNPAKVDGFKSCTPTCLPIDPSLTTKCTPVWGPPSTGGGWGSILTGIGALGTLIATILGWL